MADPQQAYRKTLLILADKVLLLFAHFIRKSFGFVLDVIYYCQLIMV